ncbi:DUF3352 domain-containing protein [Patescibacteria group bacterium]|nr:DUF3352 domain-containing protein [Patescibacteria group bacterium]
MKKITRILLVSLLAFSVLLSACGKKTDFEHASLGGNIPEEYMPGDTGILVSVSLLDDDQFEKARILQDKMDSENSFPMTFAESFNSSFRDLNLDFEKDLVPAFGEQYRMVFGLKSLDENDAILYGVATLADTAKMQSVIDTLVENDELKEKKLSQKDAYVNKSEDFYMAIVKDLLLFSNKPDGLVEMFEQNAKQSLWADDVYKKDIDKIGNDQVAYVAFYPMKLEGSEELPLDSLTMGGDSGAMNSQVLVLRAAENGIAFDGYASMDKEKADDLDASFANVPKEQAYLYKEVPAEDLIVYGESYGLKQTLENGKKVNPENVIYDGLERMVRNYTAMDFEDEVLTFMDKGYALSIHKNSEGVLPGLSIYFDVSGDKDNAEKFVDKLDGQFTGLMTLLEMSLPGAVSKGTAEVNGQELTAIVVDLNAVPRTGPAPLPTALTGEPMKLIYGIVEDRLLVTTANIWEDGGDTLAENSEFKDLKANLEGVDEGMFYLDLNKLVSYYESLEALREQLGLETTGSSQELSDMFENFGPGVAMGDTNDYEIQFKGFLTIKE